MSLCHDHGFSTGLYVPYCHRNGPFSWRRPSREEHPGCCVWTASASYPVWYLRKGGLSCKFDRVSHASVKPDQDLLVGRLIGRREEPEEQVIPSLFRSHGNRPGVRLSHIKIHLRDSSAVDRELFYETISTKPAPQLNARKGPKSWAEIMQLTFSRIRQEQCCRVRPLSVLMLVFTLHHPRLHDRRTPAGSLESLREVAHMLGRPTGQCSGGGEYQCREKLRGTHLLCWLAVATKKTICGKASHVPTISRYGRAGKTRMEGLNKKGIPRREEAAVLYAK